MAKQGPMMEYLMRGKPGRNNREIKRDINGHNIDEVVSELLARECSVQGFVAAIRDRLLRKVLQDDPANAGMVPWSITDEAAYDDAQLAGLPAPLGVAAIMPATGAAAPSSAVVGPRSHAGPSRQAVGRASLPMSSDAMESGRVSPMNGSVHGRTRRSTYEDEIQIVNENERVINESVRVSGANEMRVPDNLMDVGDGLMHARVNGGEMTVHAEVHAASPSVGGSTVSRGISPFDEGSRFRPRNTLLPCQQRLWAIRPQVRRCRTLHSRGRISFA